MDAIGPLYSEGLPDLPHARQLRGGFPWLRFEPVLEREFVRAHLDDVLPLVRVLLCLATALVGLFAMENAEVLGPAFNRLPNTLNLFVTVPLLLVTLGVTFAARRERLYQPVAALAATVCGIAQVTILCIAMAAGVGFLFPSALLMILYCYLMCGLAFYYAVAANALIFIGYFAAAWALACPARSSATASSRSCART